MRKRIKKVFRFFNDMFSNEVYVEYPDARAESTSKEKSGGKIYISGGNIQVGGCYGRGTKTEEEKEKSPIITKTEKFTAGSLNLKDLFAEVNIKPYDEEGISVEITGPEKYVGLMEIKNKDGLLSISGERVNVSYKVVEVNGVVVSGDKLPSVKILAPFKTNISVAGIFGKTVIGSFGGELEVESDMGNVEIAKAEKASLRLCGMGNLIVREYNGFLNLHNSGHGAFKVLEGNITGAKVNVEGMGKARVPEVRGELTVKNSGHGNIDVSRAGKTIIAIEGMGNVNVNEVNGDLIITGSGHGDVKVNKGSVNKLYIKTTGMGDVEFNGIAEEADLNSTGMGNIYARHVEKRPYITQKSMGEIEVGNW